MPAMDALDERHDLRETMGGLSSYELALGEAVHICERLLVRRDTLVCGVAAL